MKVKVTQEDIDKSRAMLLRGAAMRSESCPIAIALTRTSGQPASVSPRDFFLSPFPGRSTPLPLNAILFIREFDMHGTASPMEFEVSER